MKDELRTDGDPIAAYLEYCTKPAMAATPASTTLEFPGEQEMFTDMYARGRTSHIATVHLWSARCVQEEEKKAEAS